MIPGFPKPLAMGGKIEFIDSAVNNVSSSVTNTLTLPAGIRGGDLLLAVLIGIKGRTWSTPSGWTPVSPQPSAGQGTLALFWKMASGSETTVAFTISGTATRSTAAVLVYRRASAFGGCGSVNEPKTTTVSALSMTAGKGVLIGIFANDSTTLITNPPSGMALRASLIASQPKLYVYDEDWAGGTTGDRTVTRSSTGDSIGFLASVT